MNVKLIGFTPNPEKLPGMAAKLTHSETKPEELDKDSDKELKSILKYVVNLGHTSVIEHTCFTFAISDVSRSLTHQVVRHRIASYAQQSQRYVNLKNPNYVIPPTIEKDNDMKKAYMETMDIIWDQYTKLINMDIPAEDSRYVLPNAASSFFSASSCCPNASIEPLIALINPIAPKYAPATPIADLPNDFNPPSIPFKPCLVLSAPLSLDSSITFFVGI